MTSQWGSHADRISRSSNTDGVDLSRVIDRLTETITSPSSQRSLRKSSLQRTKVGANLEYAKTLLLRLERSTSSVSSNVTSNGNSYGASNGTSSPNQRGKALDLQTKREQLKQLQDQLFALSQASAAPTSERTDDSSDSEDGEDILALYAPAIRASSTIDTDSAAADSSVKPRTGPTTSDSNAAAANLTSTLRSRRAGEATAAPPNTASTTSSDTAKARPTAPSTTPFQPASTQPSGSTSETLLSHHSAEQETLTDSLLSLAQALRQSTQSFATQLEDSNVVVDTATKGLDGTVTNMEAAERRMGLLRRMTEGRGWLGRLSLYAWVAAGWVVLVLLMFVVPKLR